MTVKPFLKWAGGKRWLAARSDFAIPPYDGRYIEPFLGGGAMFFAHEPKYAVLSDLNPRLIETYQAIRDDWATVYSLLEQRQELHSKSFYYSERAQKYLEKAERAAQFLYLNRACWNGLYRENMKGEFNVPIGTKDTITFAGEDFGKVSDRLQNTELFSCDFEEIVNSSKKGDFLFLDPPYTTAHNYNGFIKYNEKIFSWNDQERLSRSVIYAAKRGVSFVMTNANHESVARLYRDHFVLQPIDRFSIISGNSSHRAITSELLITSLDPGDLSQ